jgi:L-threonylcarbamoyladenylate synthase
MRVIKISVENRREAIAAASEIVREGGIAAFPTETFYGLGVKYNDIRALEKLYELKGRPKKRAMPIIVGDRKMLRLFCSSLNRVEEKIAERFWPGPLTLLVAVREDLPELITAGTGKVAVRIPGKSFALELARSLDFPITATSANISGMLPAESAGDVLRYFGNSLDIIIDGGKTRGGKPSTIIDASGGKIKIVRHGAIPQEEIFEAAGPPSRKPGNQ